MNYPYYMQNQLQNQMPGQMPSQMQNNYQYPDEKIWVQGEDAARAYLVAPNGFVRLWDSQAAVFYEKRADQTGRPYMETYKYEKASSSNDTFKSLEDRIKALEDMMKEKVNAKSDADNSAV